MKIRTLQLNALSAVATLLIAGVGTAYSQLSELLDITNGTQALIADTLVPIQQLPVAIATTNNPPCELVRLGDTASFSVTSTPGGIYQWMYNGVAIDGQTDSTLIITNTQISDGGYYSCSIANGASTVANAASTIANVVSGVTSAPTETESASLEVFTFDADFDVVVYAFPVVSSGGTGNCPGPYAGYVNYIPTNNWGWLINTNTTIYTASDANRTNTKVEYVGEYGDEGCHKQSVTIPNPALSPQYTFSIYFTSSVPKTNYPITLSGFLSN